MEEIAAPRQQLALTLSRRKFLATLAAAAAAPALASTPRRLPNIIFILADDLGYGDTSVYGQKKVRTASIDRLAAEGMRFTNGYAGAPVCAPSRCTLMTGLHTGHCRIRDNFALAAGRVGHKKKESIRRASLLPTDRTVADHLRAAGYSTGIMGKWHLDGYDPDAVPTRHGFDEFKGWLTQVEETQGYWPEKRAHNETLVDIPENADGHQGRYDTTMITEDSIDFIERHRAQPFFLYIAYDTPHSPYTAPGLGPYANQPGWAPDEKTYAAMIHYMDRGIGLIQQTIHRLRLDQDTIIFFASDNGPRSEPTVQQTRVVDFFDSNGNLTGYKRDLYEGGIRDPLIARWPGRIAPGSLNHTPVYLPDFMPTALALASAPAAPGLDGINLVPMLLNRKQPAAPDRFLYWEFYEPVYRQAGRLGNWKVVRLKPRGPLELYDLSNDPWESHNLAQDQPEVIAHMEALLQREHRPSAEYPDTPAATPAAVD